MDLRALIHSAKVFGALTLRERVVVLGSSSLLATFPELGGADGLLAPTYDADFLLEGSDEETSRWLVEIIGEESPFRQRFGYYADFLRSGIRDVLPPGWEDRLVPLADCAGVFCLEPHDLAVAKLRAGRPKDLALLTALLATGRLEAGTVRARLDATDMPPAAIVTSYRHLARSPPPRSARRPNGRHAGRGRTQTGPDTISASIPRGFATPQGCQPLRRFPFGCRGTVALLSLTYL